MLKTKIKAKKVAEENLKLIPKSLKREKYKGTKFITVFKSDLKPTSVESKMIKELIWVGKEVGKMGFKDLNGGNFSYRTNRGMIIKTTGSFPFQLKNEDFSLVTGFKGNKVFTLGKKEPSSEARLHWSVLTARPDVNCIVHCHDFLATFSNIKVAGEGIVAEHPYGTLESARAVSRQAKKYNYLILKNHGVIAFGKSAKEAMKTIKQFHAKIEQLTKKASLNSKKGKGCCCSC